MREELSICGMRVNHIEDLRKGFKHHGQGKAISVWNHSQDSAWNNCIKKKRYQLIVNGTVQGVCYRRFVKFQARELRLTGWVKNLDNGMVEIIAEGFEEDLNKLVELCYVGPTGSEVVFILRNDEKYIKEFDSFEIDYPMDELF